MSELNSDQVEYINYVTEQYKLRNGNLNGLDESDDINYFENEALLYGFNSFNEFISAKNSQ